VVAAVYTVQGQPVSVGDPIAVSQVEQLSQQPNLLLLEYDPASATMKEWTTP
jgi:hypothetical protein